MKIPPASAYVARPLSYPTGLTPVEIATHEMVGLWSFRLGRFGCRDVETRGGVIYFLEDGRLAGGDSHYAFTGRWSLHGTELKTALHIQRLSHPVDPAELAGFTEDSLHLTVTAEAIGPGYFEGLSHRAGYADFRAVIRRISPA